jgi:HlyD family secretion protein
MRAAAVAAFLVLVAAAGGGAAAARPGAATLGGRGLLKPDAEIGLSARAGGLVTGIPRVEGDPVNPGDPVVLLDDAEERSRTALAKADLESAEIGLKKVKDGPRPEDLERAKALYDEAKAGLSLAERTLESDQKLAAGGYISELGRQRSERSLEASRAQVESRRLDLVILQKGSRPEDLRLQEIEVERRAAILAERQREETRMRIAGTRKGRAFVGRILVETGQWVEAGKMVADLVYMDRVRVELDLPGVDGLKVQSGAKAVVKAAAFPGVALEARVDRVSPVVDPASGTVRVVVVAENPDLAVRPGVEATVEIAP